MTPPIGMPTSTGAPQALKATEPATASGPDPKLLEAAKEFEAVFLRQMLKSLERSARLSGDTSQAGQSAYGSMIVEAMADAIATAGGIGVSELIADAVATSPARPAPTGDADKGDR